MELAHYGIPFAKIVIRVLFKWQSKIGSIRIGFRTRTDAARWFWQFRKAARWTRQHLFKECYGGVQVPRIVRIQKLPKFGFRWLCMRPVIIIRADHNRVHDNIFVERKWFTFSPTAYDKPKNLLDL